jgi:DNA-binding MarR family transcriptional regulator
MEPWLQQPDFAAMGLEELLLRWSGMLLWAGLRPLFQRMIDIHLTVSEHIVLKTLAHSEMTVAGVADCLSITHSAASRAVDRLVEDGFVRREEDRADRRRKLLTLAPAGQALVNDFERVMAEGVRPMIAGLSPAEQEQCRTLLATILSIQSPFQGGGSQAPAIAAGTS